ncbi:uncharacterized protein LOC116940888 [Petromyzon marinus]|uniref:uncharacterized protein LOC116940888 n=1 Tax=Petromyzon marinus TaxID=7757 RepID=UPI003F6FCC44
MTNRRRHPRDDLPVPDEEKGRFTMASKHGHDGSHYQTLPVAASHRRSEHQGFATRPRATEKRRETHASASSRGDVHQSRSVTGHGAHRNSGFDPGWNEGRVMERLVLDTRSSKPHRRSKEPGSRQTRGADVREISKSVAADQREGRRHDSEKVRRREKETSKARGDGGRSRSEGRRYVEDRDTERWKAEVKHRMELIQEYPHKYTTVEATSPRQMDVVYPGEDLYYSSYTRGIAPEDLYNATGDQTARVSARGANNREKSSRHAAAEPTDYHQPRWTDAYGPAYDSTQKHGDGRRTDEKGQLHPTRDLEAIRDAKPPSYETFQQLKNKGQIRSDYEPASPTSHELRGGRELQERTVASHSARAESNRLPHYKIPPIYPNSQQIPEQRHRQVEEYQPCGAPPGVCPARAIVHRSSRSGEAIFCLISRANVATSLHDGTRSEDAPLIKALLNDNAAEFDSRSGSTSHPLVRELQRTLRARGGGQKTMGDTGRAVHQMAPIEESQQEKRSARSWSESDGRKINCSREDRSGHDYRPREVLSSNDFTHINVHSAREHGGGLYSESSSAISDERYGDNQSRQEGFHDNDHSSAEVYEHHRGGNWWRTGEIRDSAREGLSRTTHNRDHYLPGLGEENANAAMVGEYRSNVAMQKPQAELGPSSRRDEEAFGRHLLRPTEWHHLEAIRELDDTGMRQQQGDFLRQPARGDFTHPLAQQQLQQQEQSESARRTRIEASTPWGGNSPVRWTDTFDRVNDSSRRELAQPSSYPDIAIIDASDTAITATYVSSKDYVYNLPAENSGSCVERHQQPVPYSDSTEFRMPIVNHTARDHVEILQDTARRPGMSISSVCQPPNGLPWQAVVGEIQGRVKEVFGGISLKGNEEDKEIKVKEKELEKCPSLSGLLVERSSLKESLAERTSRILGISVSEETLNVLRREMLAGASTSSQSSHAKAGEGEVQAAAEVGVNEVTQSREDNSPAGETSAGAAPRVDVPDFDICGKHLEKSNGVSGNPPTSDHADFIQTCEDTSAAVEQISSAHDHELHVVSAETNGDLGGGSSEAGGIGAEGGVSSGSKFEEQSESVRSSSPQEDCVASCSSSDCSTDTVIVVARSGEEASSHETSSAAADVYSESAEAALETEVAVEEAAATAMTNNEPQYANARSGKTEPPPLPPYPPPKRKVMPGDVHQGQPDKPLQLEPSSAEFPSADPPEDSSTWSQEDQDSSFSSDCSGSASGDEAAGAMTDAHGCRAEIEKKFAKTKTLRSGKRRKLGRQCKAQ